MTEELAPDLVAAMSNRTLGTYDGRPIRQAGMEIPGMAGGLRDALRIDPKHYSGGERVHVVAECVVAKHRHEPIDPSDLEASDWRLVHVLKVERAAIVEEADVKALLDAEQDRIGRIKDSMVGQGRLSDGEADAATQTADELTKSLHHDAGLHADAPEEGCPKCDDPNDDEAESA